MATQKINKTDLVKIIKEEVEIFKLQKQLATINNKLKVLTEGENVSEVVAGKMEKIPGGMAGGVEKWTPKFDKSKQTVNPNTMVEDAKDLDSAITGEEEAGVDKEEIMACLKTLGKALGLKGEIEFDGSDEDEAEVNAEAGVEDVEKAGAEDVDVNVETPEGEKETAVDVEEMPVAETVKPEEEECDMEETGTVKEGLAEPIEGHSVVQVAPESDVTRANPNLTKDTHVKEGVENKGEVITEAKTKELNRMKLLAGLR